MTARNYSNTASEATLALLIGAADTSVALGSFTGFPSHPFIAAIDPDTADEEVVLVTGVAGSTVTFTRAYDGSTAKAHAAGAVFRHIAAAIDFQEANDHIEATTGIHGMAGALVGTTDTQTLTNKTLTSPTIAAPTVTGTMTAAAAAFSGAVTLDSATAADLSVIELTVTGASVLADVDAEDLTADTGAFSGAVTIGGTLGITGALTGATASFSGLVTASTAPTLGGHLVNKTYADALGVSTATASTIARRDASGRLAVATPSATGDAATKGYVDTAVDAVRYLGYSSPTTTGTVGASATSVISIGVTIPADLDSNRRIKITGGAWVVTPSGVGANITLISNDGYSDGRSINVGSMSGDLTHVGIDTDLTAGARTYSLQFDATVASTVDYHYPYLLIEVI